MPREATENERANLQQRLVYRMALGGAAISTTVAIGAEYLMQSIEDLMGNVEEINTQAVLSSDVAQAPIETLAFMSSVSKLSTFGFIALYAARHWRSRNLRTPENIY